MSVVVVVLIVRKGGMETTINPTVAAAPEEEFPLIQEESWYELLLRYGLYFWGAFQLLGFLATIFIPPYGPWLDTANPKVTRQFALSKFFLIFFIPRCC